MATCLTWLAPASAHAERLFLDFEGWSSECIAAGMCEAHVVEQEAPFGLDVSTDCGGGGTCLDAVFDEPRLDREVLPRGVWTPAPQDLYFEARVRFGEDLRGGDEDSVRFVELLRVRFDNTGSVLLELVRDGDDYALVLQLESADDVVVQRLCEASVAPPRGWQRVRLALTLPNRTRAGYCEIALDGDGARQDGPLVAVPLPVGAFEQVILLGNGGALLDSGSTSVRMDDVCFGADEVEAACPRPPPADGGVPGLDGGAGLDDGGLDDAGPDAARDAAAGDGATLSPPPSPTPPPAYFRGGAACACRAAGATRSDGAAGATRAPWRLPALLLAIAGALSVRGRRRPAP